MTNRVGIYLRVSTQDQSTELQASEILKYLAARGWNHVRTYEDKATGTNANRPAFKQMMTDARARQLDVVVCWKLDRLFRSLKDLVVTLQELSDLGVEFIAIKDSIDMTTSAGRLMTHMIGAFAEFEASLIRERVRAGLANAKANGKRLGRPMRRDDSRIRDLRATGLSVRRIASEMGVSKASVQRALPVPKTQAKPSNFCAVISNQVSRGLQRTEN